MHKRRLFLKGLGAGASSFASSILFCNCCNAQEISINRSISSKWDTGGVDAGNDPTLSHRHPLAGTKRKPFKYQSKVNRKLLICVEESDCIKIVQFKKRY